MTRSSAGRLRSVCVVLAVILAMTAVWVTLGADFLLHPGWLAAQKADLILGPVLVGAYWLGVRPSSRYGWLLIAYGLLNAVYIVQSSTRPRLFGAGVVWESVIYLGSVVLILTFPTGRLDGWPARVVLTAATVLAAWNTWLVLMLPNTGAGGAISECRRACPANGLAFVPNVSRALSLLQPLEVATIAVSAGIAGTLAWRFATGTPPQRRALAIGMPVALIFLGCQIAYLVIDRFGIHAPDWQIRLRWTFTVARSGVWYGFLFALVAAQLLAGRTLRRLLQGSLERPSTRALEGMIGKAVGDPGFQLRFWNAQTESWDGSLATTAGQELTVIEQNARAAVALIHDRQLEDDPELLEAAGAIALHAAENAALDAGWSSALADLRRSRQEIQRAVDDERRRVAHDLHDGVQQRLSAIQLRLATASEQTAEEATRDRLSGLSDTVGDVVVDVREIAHGLYPHLLVELGIVPALEHALGGLHVAHNGLRRHSPEIESAVYYACLEAVQNARKHSGGGHVAVEIRDGDGTLAFIVADDGPGFDPASVQQGLGLQSLQDRIGGVGGQLEVASTGRGTRVVGSVPVDGDSNR